MLCLGLWGAGKDAQGLGKKSCSRDALSLIFHHNFKLPLKSSILAGQSWLLLLVMVQEKGKGSVSPCSSLDEGAQAPQLVGWSDNIAILPLEFADALLLLSRPLVRFDGESPRNVQKEITIGVRSRRWAHLSNELDAASPYALYTGCEVTDISSF